MLTALLSVHSVWVVWLLISRLVPVAVVVALTDEGAIQAATAHLRLHLAHVLIDILHTLVEPPVLLHSEGYPFLTRLFTAEAVPVEFANVHH